MLAVLLGQASSLKNAPKKTIQVIYESVSCNDQASSLKNAPKKTIQVPISKVLVATIKPLLPKIILQFLIKRKPISKF